MLDIPATSAGPAGAAAGPGRSALAGRRWSLVAAPVFSVLGEPGSATGCRR